jgi:hypothetical protein
MLYPELEKLAFFLFSWWGAILQFLGGYYNMMKKWRERVFKRAQITSS